MLSIPNKKLMAITYDADCGHTKIKNNCKRNGLRDVVRTSDGHLRKLPNTTLVGEFTSVQAAHTEFWLIAREAAPEAKIEKVLVIPCEDLGVYNDKMIRA